jgi:hypothetical protein
VASPVGCQCTLQPVAKTIRGSRYRCTAASTTRPSQAHKWQLYSLTQQERQGDALMSAANDSSCRTSPMLARFLQVQRVLPGTKSGRWRSSSLFSLPSTPSSPPEGAALCAQLQPGSCRDRRCSTAGQLVSVGAGSSRSTSMNSFATRIRR